MFLWIGCRLPEAFENEIRQYCLALNKRISLDTVAFSLPQHISLKISFPTDRPEEVLEDLSAFLGAQRPFRLRITGPEQVGNILWMPVEENKELQRLHQQLDERLQTRFGIPQHEFDRCFQFHSTLFMDADAEKISKM
jgi:2'-5' RNA ligase